MTDVTEAENVTKPSSGPSRAETVVAYAIPMCVLPSAVWRFQHVFTGPEGCFESAGTTVYVMLLSVVTVALGWLAVGLVQPWGERVPHWVPTLGGRPIPPAAVTALAGLGTLLLFIVYLYALLNPVFEWRTPPPADPACPPPEERADFWLIASAYAPLTLWGPLLGYLTVKHHRRRSRSR